MMKNTNPGLPFRSVLFAGLFGAASVFLATPGRAADWTPDPSLGHPDQRLKLYHIGRSWCESHFDEKVGMVSREGRHRNFMISQSLSYAQALLMTGDADERKRAEKIVALVLTKQDLRKDKPTYGSFLQLFDDTWETVVNPDPNFCQFTAVGIAELLALDDRQHRVLSPELRKQMEEALRLAVYQTMRRDVDPGYTNIALFSAAVAAAGDKYLAIPGAKDFAMCKITWSLARVVPGSTFTEYLSPTYYAVDLGGAYAVKDFSNAPDLTAAANRLIDVFWKDIADSYHAPTYQLAGPHSRSYGDNMLDYAAGLKYWLYFALDGKYPLTEVQPDHGWDQAGLVGLAAASIPVRPELLEKHDPWREVSVGGRNNGMSIRQYREGDFILGSVSTQSLWQQQRSVVAYWPVTKPEWHVGYCQDESSTTFGNGYAHYYSVQSKNAVLAAITGAVPVPHAGGLRFVFNKGAQPEPLKDGPAGAFVVHDGEVTTYIYPVTKADGHLAPVDEPNRLCLDRAWSTADPAGKVNVLSYLVVFQLPGQAVPVVKNLSLDIANQNTSISAEVNGTPLSLKL